MPQKPIELILMRQLASSLATPIFLVDADGTLVFSKQREGRFPDDSEIRQLIAALPA